MRPHIRALDRAEAAGGRAIDLEPLLGAWLNYDTNSAGPRRLWISRRSSRLVVSTPHLSDVDGAAFTAGVTATRAVGFLAHADGMLLAAYLNKRLLVVDTYTRGPVNTFRRDHFYPL
ncbi:MAG TPA: hypothetical protein VGD48_34260 [Kutzneria sp.]|jgi:hypothetical protein